MALRFTVAELAGNAMISLVMSAVMSVFMIAMNAGFGPEYLRAVAFSWMLGTVVSFPTALVVVPPVIRWQSRHLKSATKIPEQ